MNAPWKPGGSREPFQAYLCDEVSIETLRPVVEELGWQPEKCHKGGLRNAIQSLSVSASPQILLVDLSESGDPLNDINALAEVCEPGTIVIAMGQVNDVRLYRDLVVSGLQDYLLKPVSPDVLRDALVQAQAIFNAPRVEDHGNEHEHVAIAVVGTRGGVGATTIATSLAWSLSDQKGCSTALLDLDIHFGTGALAMDLEPGRGLTDAIDNPSRIDGLFIERAMIKASENLALLSAEAPINAPVMTDGAAFTQLQEEFRTAFQCAVIDLPRSMLINYPQLLNHVGIVVVVVDLTLASARDAIRLLSWLKSNAPNARLLVVANKLQSGVQEISRKDFESSIEHKIDLTIAFDQKAAAQAAKIGKPIVEAAKSSKVSVGIRQLADDLLSAAEGDEDDKSAKKGGVKSKPAKKHSESFSGLKALLQGKKSKKSPAEVEIEE